MDERYGFIHEKLDIKILILYILARLPAPIDLETLADLTLCDGGIGYFEFAECAADLVRTGHVLLERNMYSITDKGRRNGAVTESGLPYPVRLKADKGASKVASELNRAALISASHTVRPRGGCTVTLSMSDGLEDIFAMELFTADAKQSALIEKNFRANAESIYMKIVDMLLESEHDS